MKNNPTNLFTQINTNKNDSRRFVKKKFVGKAFTLIEILIAIFVLEIGLLGIASFYSYSFKISKIARNETIAANLASGLLDNKLAIAYDNLPVLFPGSKERYSIVEGDPFYDWYKQIDIVYIDSNLVEQTSKTNMKKITVTVYWQESGQEKSFQTASIKARH